MAKDKYPKNKDPKNTDPTKTAAYKRYKAEGTPLAAQHVWRNNKFVTIAQAEKMDKNEQWASGHPAGGGGVSPMLGAPAGGASIVPIPLGQPATSPESKNFPPGTVLPGTTDITRFPQGFPVPSTMTPSAPGAPPSWWIPNTYSGNLNEQQKFASIANAVLPTLSPEDQRSLGRYLSTNFADIYGGYGTAKFAPIPNQLGNERKEYLNPARANAALGLLEKMKAASGGADMGAGYKYLTDVVKLLNQFSTNGGPMTREQFVQFQMALKGLQAQAGKDIGAYANLANMFSQPTFSAGPLMSNAPSGRLVV